MRGFQPTPRTTHCSSRQPVPRQHRTCGICCTWAANPDMRCQAASQYKKSPALQGWGRAGGLGPLAGGRRSVREASSANRPAGRGHAGPGPAGHHERDSRAPADAQYPDVAQPPARRLNSTRTTMPRAAPMPPCWPPLQHAPGTSSCALTPASISRSPRRCRKNGRNARKGKTGKTGEDLSEAWL